MTEKILIVDDDLDTLKLVGLMLQRQGYEIVAANNGTQALDKIGAERPDLILLDVMMPDMDGYEVTRRIRAMSGSEHTPIIMFTAKTLVDDKVAGFEAGVDDYMTKPTHPAELASRVKALLARSTQTRAASSERGKIIGVIGAKGGLGASTMALNVSTALTNAGLEVTLCELRPGPGTIGLQLGYSRSTGLSTLLSKNASEINPHAVENQLATHGSGLRLLLASYTPNDIELTMNADAGEAIVKSLATLTKYLVIDLGNNINELVEKVVAECDTVILIVEPFQMTLHLGKAVLERLEQIGLGPGRIEVVIVNRTRSSLQLSLQTVENVLGHNVASVITPAPELAYQAAEANSSMIALQPESLTADLYRQLADRVQTRLGGRTPAAA